MFVISKVNPNKNLKFIDKDRGEIMFVISKVNLNKNLKFIDKDRGVVVCT